MDNELLVSPFPPAPDTEQISLGKAHPSDAGLDLVANEEITIAPLGRALVGTGIAIALPENTVGMVCPRSGLAVKFGVTVLNGPGIIDSGYRGEVRVPLHNSDPENAFTIRPGDRIAQLVVLPLQPVTVRVVSELPAADRGNNGFGSSGGFTSAAGKES